MSTSSGTVTVGQNTSASALAQGAVVTIGGTSVTVQSKVDVGQTFISGVGLSVTIGSFLTVSGNFGFSKTTIDTTHSQIQVVADNVMATAVLVSDTVFKAQINGGKLALIVNQDGSIRDLGGFSTITSTSSLAREGIDERQFRLGLRLSF